MATLSSPSEEIGRESCHVLEVDFCCFGLRKDTS